ncbi:MAG: HEPN domain-containing protein [Armatimonadetes bacterium]|nr:HEPN domain-containing protein [Armatimonadota bacterium]MDW8027238.1 HEPN domain-containing protein [Armatimonadota bacterium]
MPTKVLDRTEVLQNLRKAVEAVRQICEPEFVVLFGSYAYGEPNESSDVDVLVVYPDEVEETKRREAGAILHQVFGTGLEVHPCTISQWREALLKRNWFVAEITQKGTQIFSRREWEAVLAEVSELMSQSQNLYPYEWLDWAEDDWWVVHRALDEGRVFIAAYQLQQAVEKWLKGFLLYHGWQLERIHDLEDLLKEAVKREPSLQKYQAMCHRVKYFIAARYPGLPNPPTSDELRQQWLQQVEELREFVRRNLGVQ